MANLKSFTEERPWGGFRRFIQNESCTVKILSIRKGEAFSLQKHKHRAEFWRVLAGNPDVTIDDKIIKAKPGDEFNISQETNHRIFAPINDVEVLEIAQGDFDEEDIVRLEDKYGRS